jgi:hypothetical protein
MSRTSHHKGQKAGKDGLDFGSRYRHNWGYGAGCGRTPKDCAHKEMRNDAKVACQAKEHWIEYWEERYWVEPLDDTCSDCGLNEFMDCECIW